MFGNRGGESKRFDDERVVIGLFPSASGAGRFTGRGRRSTRADAR
jgi:hypothetical protein